MSVPIGRGGSEAPLRVGIDLCWAADVDRAVARFGDRYLRRVYTDRELGYCADGGSEQAERLAARFAAKEATLKVLRPADEGVDWRAIEVVRAPDGWCEMRLAGAMADLATRSGIASLSVSLSHEGGLAAAIVLAEVPRDPSTTARLRDHSEEST